MPYSNFQFFLSGTHRVLCVLCTHVVSANTNQNVLSTLHTRVRNILSAPKTNERKMKRDNRNKIDDDADDDDTPKWTRNWSWLFAVSAADVDAAVRCCYRCLFMWLCVDNNKNANEKGKKHKINRKKYCKEEMTLLRSTETDTWVVVVTKLLLCIHLSNKVVL